MEFDNVTDVYVRNSVAVCQAEGFVTNVGLNSLYPSTGHRLVSGVNAGHTPGLGVWLMDSHIVLPQIKSHVGVIQKVVTRTA